MKKYTLSNSFKTAIQIFGKHPLHLFSKLCLPILLTSLAMSFAIYTCVNCIVAPASRLPLTSTNGHLHNIINAVLHLEVSSWLKIAIAMLLFITFNSIMLSAFKSDEVPTGEDKTVKNKQSIQKYIKALIPQALKNMILSSIRLIGFLPCIIGIFYGMINGTIWLIVVGIILLIVVAFSVYHAGHIWTLSPRLALRGQTKALYTTYRPHIGKLTIFALIYRPIQLCLLLMLFLPAIVSTVDYFYDSIAIGAGEISGLPAYFTYLYLLLIWIGCVLFTWAKLIFLLPTKFLLPIKE